MHAVLAQLPWYHQLALLDKLTSPEARRWYAAKATEHNWSRNVLVMQIETQLLDRTGHCGRGEAQLTQCSGLNLPPWSSITR